VGTAVHKGVELSIAAGGTTYPDTHGLDDVDAERVGRMVDQWAKWWGGYHNGRWQTEVPFAWNVKTGAVRKLPRAEHRDYGDLEDYEVPGTADAVLVDAATVTVYDWKTGRANVEPPATNPQLAFLGGAAMSLYGTPHAEVGIVKVSEDGVLSADHTMDTFDTIAIRAEVLGMVEKIPKAEPKPGPWCQFCPAKGTCPATTSSVAEIVSAASLVRRPTMSLEIADNDHAAGMLTAIDGVEAFISELKKRLRDYADLNGGIEMPDGTVWAKSEVTTERPDLETPEAMGVITGNGWAKALEHKVTWSAIKRLYGAAAEKAARDQLRQIGAVKTSVAPRYEARAKKGRAA